MRHIGPLLTQERKLFYVKSYLNGPRTEKNATRWVLHGRARKPPEVFTTRTLRSWVHEYQKHEAVPGARGRPSAKKGQFHHPSFEKFWTQRSSTRNWSIIILQMLERWEGLLCTRLSHGFASYLVSRTRSEMSERPRARFKNIKSETTLRSLRIFKPSRILNIPTCDFSLTNSRLWTWWP